MGPTARLWCAIARAWMFKEVDSQLLGWEVYARKETFYKESGIVLGADATKLKKEEKAGEQAAGDETTPLQYALASFVQNCFTVQTGVADYASNYDANDTAGLVEYLAGLSKSRLPAAGYQEGYEATVIALKANEAIQKGQRIVFEKEWFDLA